MSKGKKGLGRFQKAMYEFLSLYPRWQTIDLRYDYNRRISASLVDRGLIEQHSRYTDMFRVIK